MELDDEENCRSFYHEELHFAGQWKGSSRIKFLAVDGVQFENKYYVALGTNNGSVYLFQRSGVELHHQTTLKKEEASVVKLKFTASGNRLASALRNGSIIIFALNFDQHHFESVRVSQLHKDSIITALVWKDEATLYSGDSKGFVSVTLAPTSKSKDLMSLPSAPVQHLQSPVVQIDASENLLCVSTEKAAFLFDSESRTFRTIGSKSRQGKFGAGFAFGGNGKSFLFCARPGYRLWQTEGDNIVSVTHQYKDLSKMEPSRIWGQPIIFNSESSRSGIFCHINSIGNDIIACIDVNLNFYFINFIDKLTVACLPRPNNVVTYSLDRSGNFVILLEDNKLCAISYLPLIPTANLLIASEWISDAVEFIVSIRNNEELSRNVSESALSRFIEAVGEGDPNYKQLCALRDSVRAWKQSLLERRESEISLEHSLSMKVTSNGVEDEVDGDALSETSERSVNSNLDPFDLSRRSDDLLAKMKSKWKITSKRFRHEISHSEKAQNLVKIMKDKTTKMKSDAEQFIVDKVDKVSLIPVGVPTELSGTHDYYNHQTPPSSSSQTKKKQQRVGYCPSSRSNPLNFVELEAAASILWERWSNRSDERLTRASVSHDCIRRSIAEFVSVMNRLMTNYHALLPSSQDVEEYEGMLKDTSTMTIQNETWKEFPLPSKLTALCGRIGVLAFFFVFSTRSEGEDEEENEEEMDYLPEMDGEVERVNFSESREPEEEKKVDGVRNSEQGDAEAGASGEQHEEATNADKENQPEIKNGTSEEKKDNEVEVERLEEKHEEFASVIDEVIRTEIGREMNGIEEEHARLAERPKFRTEHEKKDGQTQTSWRRYIPVGGTRSSVDTKTLIDSVLKNLNMYDLYGFEKETFQNLTLVINTNETFWRKCLQQFPMTSLSFSRHMAAVAEVQHHRDTKFRQIDWSSGDAFNILETAIVTDPLYALRILLRLFASQPEQALRFSVQNSGHVALRDVFNILRYHHQFRMLIDYVVMMMEEIKRQADPRHFVEELNSNDDIVITICMLCAVFENESVTENQCQSCQRKIYLPGDVVSQRNVIPFLFDKLKGNSSLDFCEEWLRESGHVTQYCQAIVALNKVSDLIKLAFQLDRSDFILNFNKLNMEQIHLIVDLMVSANPPSCLYCGNPSNSGLTSWNWPFVGHIMTQYLAPPVAVKLLSEVKIPSHADLSLVFQIFASTSLNSHNCANEHTAQKPLYDPGGGQMSALLRQCHRTWGIGVMEFDECYLCGKLVFEGKDELEITPCCHNIIHRDCLPLRQFCTICLR